jgi:hypothetical protein
MTDLIYTGAIRSPEEYAAARERLKRLRASPDVNTVPDIVALQGEISKYECAPLVLASEPGFSDDEHETNPGAAV